MQNHVADNRVVQQTPTNEPRLHNPVDSGPISPLVLPSGLSRIQATRLVECLRHIVTTGTQPSPSLFFQQNGPRERAKCFVKFAAISLLSFGLMYSVAANLAAIELISGTAGFVASTIGAIGVAVLRTRAQAREASLLRQENRALWGFSRETKEMDLKALEEISKLATETFSGLSERIAARHRWKFDVHSSQGSSRAAAVVAEAITSGDDISTIEDGYQIDAGNIRRYRDTGLAILIATSSDLTGDRADKAAT